MRRVLFVVALLVAVPVSAQNVVNPSTVTFTASDDHAAIDKYILGYFAPGATAPVQEADLGKPTPDAGRVCAVSLNTRPLAFGVNYTAKVKALAGTTASEWSEASNPFDRRPGKTGAPVVK